jgi:hypothetical protein
MDCAITRIRWAGKRVALFARRHGTSRGGVHRLVLPAPGQAATDAVVAHMEGESITGFVRSGLFNYLTI